MVTGPVEGTEEELTQEELHDDLMALQAQAHIGHRPLPPWADEDIEPWIAPGEFSATDVRTKYEMTWSAADARIKKWIKQKKVRYVGQRRAYDATGSLVKVVKAYAWEDIT